MGKANRGYWRSSLRFSAALCDSAVKVRKGQFTAEPQRAAEERRENANRWFVLTVLPEGA